MKADKAGEYTRVEDLSKLTFAAEKTEVRARLHSKSFPTTPPALLLRATPSWKSHQEAPTHAL